MRQNRQWVTFGVGLAALLAFLGWTQAASAQRGTTLYGDPKEELRRALANRSVNHGELVRKAIKNLRSLRDLREALALPNWPQTDQSFRRQVGQLFQDRVNAAVQSSDPTTRLAAADLLGDIGTSIVGFDIPGSVGLATSLMAVLGTPLGADPFLAWDLILGRDSIPSEPSQGGFMRSFTPQLIALVNDPDPRVRQMAARSIGKVNPDPQMAVAALRKLLRSPLAGDRQAAVEGLYSMIQVVSQLQGTVSGGRGTSLVQATLAEILTVGEGVVATAHFGLEDEEKGVREVSLLAIQKTALTLESFMLSRGTNEVLTETDLAIQKGLLKTFQPLLNELKNQGASLTRLLDDPDPQVQLTARRTLEEFANVHYRLRRLEAALGLTGENPRRQQTLLDDLLPVNFQAEIPSDPLVDGLRPAVDYFANKGISSPQVADRLIAIGFLELLDDAAAAAAPSLIKAMSDANRFVRWAAARALSRTGPIDQETMDAALSALTKMLSDPDLDLRVTAATTLARFGSLAIEAVPALARAAQTGDAEIRIAGMRTLSVIGLGKLPPQIADDVISAVVTGLTNSDVRVRKAAAETLGRFGPPAQAAIPALRKAMDDEDLDVRRAASEAVLDISGH